MATGIPQKQPASNNSAPPLLSYDGKVPEREILEQIPQPFRARHQGNPEKRLYFGDNLEVLRTLLDDPKVCRRVGLIYIDPPYATQSHFVSRTQQHAYTDTLIGGEFVEFLRQRLILLRELLADHGSVYLHLDETMMFEMKLVMDEVFGSGSYRNLIVRKKCNPKNYTRRTYGNIADFILFYTKTNEYVWNRPTEALSADSLREYRYIEPETQRRFMKVPVHAPGERNGETGTPWRGKLPPPGKHWQYPPQTLDEMDARGEIFWSKNDNPRRKVYLDEHQGVGVQDIWLDFKDAHNQNIKITGYPTEKNPDLLRRIISASSNPGDLVLDCFAGSGTTLAVADEMGRNWIGADNSIRALETMLSRFKSGLQPMGDYVGGKAPASNPIETQGSFFDGVEQSLPEENKPVEPNQSTGDFMLLLPETCPAEMEGIVTAWQTSGLSGPSGQQSESRT